MFDSSARETTAMTRRAFMAAAATAGIVCAFDAATHGRHALEIIRRNIAVRDLPDGMRGFRIVQISDIHLEEFTEPWYLRRVVEQVNALQADLVVITGDFISRGPRAPDVAARAMPLCADTLASLTCPLRYAILGNHDVAVSARLVIRELAHRGIPTLVNSFVPIERGGDRFWLAGVDDPGTSHPNLTAAIPAQPGAPVILMAHEPDYADRVCRHPRAPLIDLMLSGHSHGGQIRLPLLGPLVLPPMGKKYIHGHFQFGNMQLYVNRGIGTVGMPFRFDCPSEITELTLQRA